MGFASSSTVFRVCATLLVVGGLLGIAVSAYAAYHFFQQHWLPALFPLGLIALFGWAVVVGAQLWLRSQYGQRWTLRFFVSQIPALSFPGLFYQWYTGAALTLAVGEIEQPILLRIGGGADFHVGIGQTEGGMVGINLIALAAAYCLWRARSAPSSLLLNDAA